MIILFTKVFCKVIKVATLDYRFLKKKEFIVTLDLKVIIKPYFIRIFYRVSGLRSRKSKFSTQSGTLRSKPHGH